MSVWNKFSDTGAVIALYPKFEGKLAFDIGANSGMVAKVLAEHFDRVVSCEPSNEPYVYLAALAGLEAPNLIPLQVAVSDHEGTVELVEREMSRQTGMYFTGASLTEWGAETRRHIVPCTRLDTLAAEYGFPDFVKIDTEGHDWLVVQGAAEVFARRPEFLIEVHDVTQGALIEAWLTVRGLDFVVLRHEQREEGSPGWLAHYWLSSRAK